MESAVLDHVAFGVPDVAPVAEVLVAGLGGRERDVGPGVGFLFWQWKFANDAAVEILEPDGPPDGFLHRFLAARGAGVHHVTFKVKDIHAAMARASEHGIEPVGFDDRWPGWKECFLHPKQAQGIVVQLAESHPELEADANYPRQEFPKTPAPGPAARVLGLRLAARSQERARAQWETLLGGRAETQGDTLVFRWADSPLRIAVGIEAEAPEGPRALELSAEHDLGLPEGPHPLLGLPLVQV